MINNIDNESRWISMTYQVKRTIVTIAAGIVLLAAYLINGYLKIRSGGAASLADLGGWATTMLVFIGIGVGLEIVTQIVFHVVVAAGGEIKRQVSAELNKKLNPDGGSQPCGETGSEIEKEDEMDKLIGLKATKVGYAVAGFGFVASLVTLAVGLPPAVMLNTAFLTFITAGLLEGFAQLHYYRRGVR